MSRSGPIALAAAAVFALLAGANGPADARGGHVREFGAFGRGHKAGEGHRGHGMRAKTSIYVVIDVPTITDQAAFRKSIESLTASVMTSAGRTLVDADGPISVNGTPPQHVSIIAFDSVTSAQAWENTPAFKAFSADVQKEGTVSIYAVGGISDAVPAAGLPADARGSRDTRAGFGNDLNLPAMPAIKDICKGC